MLHVEFLHSSFLHVRGGWRQDGWCIAPGKGGGASPGQAEALRRRSATLGHNRHNRSKPRRDDGYVREAHSYSSITLCFPSFLKHDNVSVTPSGFWLQRLSWPRVPLALHPGLRVLRPPNGGLEV